MRPKKSIEDGVKINAVEAKPQGNSGMTGDFDNPLPAINTKVSDISKAQEEDPKLKLVRDWVRKGEKTT